MKKPASLTNLLVGVQAPLYTLTSLEYDPRNISSRLDCDSIIGAPERIKVKDHELSGCGTCHDLTLVHSALK